MVTITLARHAMATRFELVLNGRDASSLRAAGEEALDEIERLENQLSVFRPTSEIAALNAQAARRPVRVSPEVFGLLQQAKQLHARSEGAFDIAIASLVNCWGFLGGSGHRPRTEVLLEARQCAGMHLVEMDEGQRTVHFKRPGVMLDLGAIGKGYAIDRAALILREAGVESALLHGGTSTVYGLGRPLDAENWVVGIDRPPGTAAPGGDSAVLARVSLHDEALSVSGIHGKCFQEEDKTLGHIIDPRTGEPAAVSVLAVVVSPSATESDALSTALLVGGEAILSRLDCSSPGLRTLVANRVGSELHVKAHDLHPL